MKSNDTFKFVVPASLSKSDKGKWIVKGLASEEVEDLQGEILIQKGMDFSNIDAKRGLINWDHDNSPESTIGLLTGYHRDGKRTYIEGELFQKHDKAKAVYSIMESLQESGSKAMGISVEGSVLERDPTNRNIIKKCRIKNVALTLNPVFQDSYAELVKSFNAAEEIDFQADGKGGAEENSNEAKIFSATEVVDLVAKALSAGYGQATQVPAERSGGDALAQEDLEKDEPTNVAAPKKKKKPSKIEKSLVDALEGIQKLYPHVPKAVLWEAFKERLNKKFVL